MEFALLSLLVGGTSFYVHDISGTVYDAQSGVPVEGAQVELYIGQDKILEGETDEDGCYSLALYSTKQDPYIRLRAEAWGLVPSQSSGWVSSVREDLHLEPTVVCVQSSSQGVDIDCMGLREIAATLQALGVPLSDDTIGKSIEEMSSAYAADGRYRLLVLSPDGQPTAVASPRLLSASASFSVGEMPSSMAVYQYQADLDMVDPPLEEVTTATTTITSCPNVSGSDWEGRTYYGRHDNTWCSYRSSENSCTSCCDTGMATCTGASVGLGAAIASTCGPWCVVAGVAVAAIGSGVCYSKNKKCVRGCRCKVETCVDAFGNVITEQLTLDEMTMELLQWRELDQIVGVIWHDVCEDKYVLTGSIGQHDLALNVSGSEAILRRFRAYSGNSVTLRGLFDLNEEAYMATEAAFDNPRSLAPNATTLCPVTP